MDAYRTIRGEAKASYEIQKSRFIAWLRHAESEEEARAFLQQAKRQYFDARHNPSAWALGPGGARQKSNDDGEPGGTAGSPILEALRKNGLTDVAAVVTRYFGGIKLGAGGLARAYGHAAVLAIEAAEIVAMTPFRRARLSMDYSLLAIVERWLRDKGITVESSEYAERVALAVLLPLGEEERLLAELADLTAARCGAELLEETLVALPAAMSGGK